MPNNWTCEEPLQYFKVILKYSVCFKIVVHVSFYQLIPHIFFFLDYLNSLTISTYMFTLLIPLSVTCVSLCVSSWQLLLHHSALPHFYSNFISQYPFLLRAVVQHSADLPSMNILSHFHFPLHLSNVCIFFSLDIFSAEYS